MKAAALEAELTGGAIDVTLPGRAPSLGHLHITTQALHQLYAIFAEMGFQVYDAPDVETDDYNFGLLNIPPYHPARDMWDTFWVSQDADPDPGRRNLLLRTPIRPGQIRVIRERCPEPRTSIPSTSSCPPRSPTPPSSTSAKGIADAAIMGWLSRFFISALWPF